MELVTKIYALIGGVWRSIGIMVGATGAADGLPGLVPQPMAGDESKVLQGDGTWVVQGGGGGGRGSTVLFFGNNNISNTTATRYASPGYDQSLAMTQPVGIRMPYAGTVKNLYIRHNTPNGDGDPVVYTVRVGGTDTALLISVASDVMNGQNTADSAAVLAGQTIDISIAKALAIGSGQLDLTIGLEYEAA